MTILYNPHDRFFKTVFGRTEVAVEFLERYLPPAVVATLDWTTLRPEKDAFLDPELTQHPADLLYAVDLRGGGRSYVHVLFEHKSYVEARINLDLLRYRVRIWEQWLNEEGNRGLLPVIVPVVFYHGAAAWRVSRQFADTVDDAPVLRAYVPSCVYHLVDLSAYRDEELRGAVRLQVALLTLKYVFQDELRERLPGILGLLRELEQSSSGLDFIRALLRYLAQVASTDRLSGEELRQAVTQALSGGGDLMMTIAEQWEQQGIEKGIERGEARALLRLVQAKFGPPGPAVEARVQAAESAQVERWLERILTANSPDDLFE